MSLNREKAAVELQILLTSSKYRLDSDDISRLQALARHEYLDWGRVFSLAHRHKVFPRVWSNISSAAPEVISDEIRETQKNFLRRQMLHCAAITGQLCRISDLFDRHRIAHVPYKGPVLAGYLFNNFAMRTYGDLDILIAAADFPQVAGLLSANGYTPEIDIPPQQQDAYAAVEDNLTFMPVAQGAPIEVHWELSGRYLAKPMGFEHVSRRLSQVLVQGRAFPIFSPEDLLVYFCLHGTKHGWSQLDLIACLAELILKERGLSWELAFQVSDEFKCRRMVYVGLLLAKRVYGIELPREVQAAVDEDRQAFALSERLWEILQNSAALQSGDDEVEQDARFSLLRLQIRDSRLDGARYLLRMLFYPSKSEWKAFRLPAWFTVGYWIARPFRVLWAAVAGTVVGKWRRNKMGSDQAM